MNAIIIFVGVILFFLELMFYKLLDMKSTLKEINNRLKAICIILENERKDGETDDKGFHHQKML